MTDPDVATDPSEEASARLANLTWELDHFFNAAGEVNDFNHLAHYLNTLRDVREHLALVISELERAALVAMPEKRVEVPFLGMVERKKSTRRTKWDHDSAFRSVVARVADEPGVFYSPEDGGLLPPAVLAANLVDRLRGVLSPSWKVTGLRELGLQVDEFCQEDEAVDQLVLPPKAAA